MAEEKKTLPADKIPDIKKKLASLSFEDLGLPPPPPRKGEPGYEEYLEAEKNKAPWNAPEDSPKFCCNAEYWLPTAQKHAPTPKTIIVPVKHELMFLCDGITPKGYDELLKNIENAVNEIGWPAFIRTGQTSNKHSWKYTCGGCKSPADLPRIIGNLTEISGMADLPLVCFMVREMLPTKPIFLAFEDMPVTREFRFFAENGEITHIQPYWPEDALLMRKREWDDPNTERKPYVKDDVPDWKDKLSLMSALSTQEYGMLAEMSKAISKELPLPQGGWSIDWLQDSNGKWWLTDMAVEILSYRWEPDFKVVDDEKYEKAVEAGIIPGTSTPAPAPAM